ncbi:hypothetical protein MRX96_048418, partial [Rhipicephalus microplus]
VISCTKTYRTSTRWAIKRYDGFFYNYTSYNESQEPFDAVDIKARNILKAATEVLYYQSSDNNCAVFSVLSSRGPKLYPSYDIRIKDSYIKTHSAIDKECWEKFVNVSSRRKITRLYDRRCRQCNCAWEPPDSRTGETRRVANTRVPLQGPQRYAEATYALIEARCDRDTAIENRRLQLEEDRFRFEIKLHEQKMKLKEMELQQRQAEQEAKFKLKELELEALAEERRHNRGYQEAQLEIIKSFINK